MRPRGRRGRAGVGAASTPRRPPVRRCARGGRGGGVSGAGRVRPVDRDAAGCGGGRSCALRGGLGAARPAVAQGGADAAGDGFGGADILGQDDSRAGRGGAGWRRGWRSGGLRRRCRLRLRCCRGRRICRAFGGLAFGGAGGCGGLGVSTARPWSARGRRCASSCRTPHRTAPSPRRSRRPRISARGGWRVPTCRWRQGRRVRFRFRRCQGESRWRAGGP